MYIDLWFTFTTNWLGNSTMNGKQKFKGVKTHNPSANQRRAISSVGMESSFLAIRQDGEQIVHTQGTGVVLVYVWRWSSHIEISGKRPIRSGLGIVV